MNKHAGYKTIWFVVIVDYCYTIPMGIFGKKVSMRLSVEGMTCGHCEMKVRDALSAVPGVKKVLTVDRTANEAVVSVGDPEKVSEESLVQAVTDAGYTAKV